MNSTTSYSMPMRIVICSVLLIGLLAIVAFEAASSIEAAPLAATFTVNSVGDAVDANPGNGICATAAGRCTLRAAIQEANANAGGDVIDLRAGPYVLSIAGSGENAAATGDLDITESLEILGAGETSTTIDGDQLDRVFHIIGSIEVSISGVTIRNGLTPAGEDGGGVLTDNNATLFLSDSIVQGNNATHWGGGLHNDEDATTIIADVTFLNNIAGVLGGGIDNYQGTVNISDSRIFQNQVTAGPGGGLYNGAGAITEIEDTTIEGNSATTDGGGVYNYRPDSATTGSLEIRRTLISLNEATLNGGGIYNFGLLQVVQNTTLSNNEANDRGGAIYNSYDPDPLDTQLLNHLTIYENSAGVEGGGIYNDIDSELNIQNSIVANNQDDNCRFIEPITSDGYNVESADSCGFYSTQDEINRDPLLADLADNGGPTRTHKPAANSTFVIDQANTVGPPATDQRSIERPQGDGHDVGAHEHKMADLSITKSDDPDPVYAGQLLTYTLTVANAGQSDALSVSVSDTLPADTTFVSVSATGWNCSHINGTVLCSRPMLMDGVNSTITIVVTAPDEGGTITNQARIGSSITDLRESDNQVSANTAVTAVADLSLTKSDDVDPVNAAHALEYTLEVENLGPSAAAGLMVTDTLMADVKYENAEGAGWSCSYDEPSHTVTCLRGSLGVGSAPPIRIDVISPDEDGPVYNIARVSSDVVDLTPDNNEADEFTSVTAVSDLAVSKSDPGGVIYSGENLTYTVSVDNLGPSTATSVKITDTLPAGVTFLSASATGWLCEYESDTHEVVCGRASLGEGPTQNIQIVVAAPDEGGSINNNVTVTSDALDLDTSNNSDIEATIITAKSDLAITQSHSPAWVYAEGTLVYRLHLENEGPSTATDVVVSSTLPSDVDILSAAGTGWTCTPNQNDNVVVCTRPALAPGSAPDIELSVEAPPEGGVTVNHADVTATTYDPQLSNNAITEDVTVVPVADLEITISDAPDPVDAAQSFVYTLTILNNGPSMATGIEVTNTLPSDVDFVSALGADWSCTNDGNFNVITCDFSDELVEGETSIIEITVVAPDDGVSLNNSAVVASPITDFDLSNNSDSEVTVVGPVADLSVEVSGAPDPVDATEALTYTVSVQNDGPSAATTITMTDELHPDVSFVSADGTGWDCSYLGASHEVTCLADELALGAAPAITIVVNAPAEGDTVDNLATVSAVTIDRDLNNNADSVEVTVRPVADLSISLSDNSDPVDANTSLIYTLEVSNNGPSTATALETVFELPEGTSFNNVSGAGWSCTAEDNIVTCIRANLVAGATGTINVVLTAPIDGGTITAHGSIESETLDKDLSNNEDSEETTITPVADLAIGMSDLPDPVNAGDLLEFTLTITNTGPSAATAVQVIDTLSPDVEYVSAEGADWSCGYSSTDHQVSCLAANLSVGTAPQIIITVMAPNDENQLDNTAQVSAATIDPNPANNITTTDTTTNPIAELSIAVADDPDPVEADTTLLYTISTANAGPSVAVAPLVTATLPTGANFISATGLDWNCAHDDGLVTCFSANMPLGSAPDITIVTDAPAEGGTGTIMVSLTSDTDDLNPVNNTDTEETTIIGLADLVISMSDMPDPVNAGDVFTFTLTVSNAGPSTAQALVVVDELSPDVMFQSAAGSGWTCAYNNVAHEVGCERASLAIAVAPDIIIEVVAPNDQNSLDNTATVSSDTMDPNQANNTDTTETETNPVVDLAISIEDDPDPVDANTALLYTLLVDNNGPSQAVAVSVSATLPDDATFVSVNGSMTWACAHDSGVVTCQSASLATGPAQNIDLVVIAPPDHETATLTASISSSTEETDSSNNSASEVTTVTQIADLEISMSDLPDPVDAGESVIFDLTISNHGPSSAEAVTMIDTLSPNVEYVSAEGSDWSCAYDEDTHKVTCETASIAPNLTSEITLEVFAPNDINELDNTAQVSAETSDPDLSNNDATTDTTVTSIVDISIDIEDNPDPVEAATTMAYTIVVDNAGPSVALAPVLTVILPTDAIYINATGSSWTCVHESGEVTCISGSLAVGQAPQILLTVVAPPDGGTATLTASITSETQDSNTSNNSETEETTIIPISDLSVSKSESSDPVYAADLLTYTVSVVNDGPSRVAGVQVIDTLPPEASFVQAFGTGWSCLYDAEDHLVSCMRANALPVGDAPAISIVVRAPTFGGFLDNTVRVSSSIDDPDLSNNAYTEGTDVTPLADLSLTVIDEPDPVYIGHTLLYTMQIQNLGPSIAELVTVTHQLEQGVNYLKVTEDGWSCTYNQFDHAVSCFIPNLAVGLAPEINIVTEAPNWDGVVGSQSIVTGSTLDLDLSNNSLNQETTVTSEADLSIQVSNYPGPVQANEIVTHILRIDNHGPAPAQQVEATIILPNPSEFNDCPDALCIHDNGIVRYPLPDMEAGETQFITITITPMTNQGIVAIASINSVTPDYNQDNNEAHLGVNWIPIFLPIALRDGPSLAEVDLTLTISDEPDPVRADRTLLYTLHIRNRGRDNAGVVAVQATLPDDATFISAEGEGWSCQYENAVLTCTRLNLPSLSHANIIITTNPPPDTALAVIEAVISTNNEDGHLDNNSDSEETTVIPIADLSVSKRDSSDPVYAGYQFTYTLDVVNHGPSTVPSADVIDTLPPEATFIGMTGAGWDCGYNATNHSAFCSRSEPLAPGAAPAISLVLQAPEEAGILDNVVQVVSPLTDPNYANNADLEGTTIVHIADLSISVSDSPSSVVEVNGELRYTIRIDNAGPTAPETVTVRADLPATVEFEDVSTSDWLCNYNSTERLVTCSDDNLALGEAPDIQITVTPLVENSVVTSYFTVEGSTVDFNPANNSATEETSVVEQD